MPEWLTGDVLDVRRTVMEWLASPLNSANNHNTTRVCRVVFVPIIYRQLTVYFLYFLCPH